MQRASEATKSRQEFALSLSTLNHSGAYPSVVRSGEGHVPRDTFSARVPRERKRVDGPGHSYALGLLSPFSVPCDDSIPRLGLDEH